jgi:hypothetical protein
MHAREGFDSVFEFVAASFSWGAFDVGSGSVGQANC